MAEAVQLTLAPLKDWQAPNGNTYRYYHCQPTLVALAKKHLVAGLRLLVIVDGPPAATGKHARYPAGPLILEYFAGAQIDLLIDDYIRDDEKEIAQLWQADIATAQLTQITTERRAQKRRLSDPHSTLTTRSREPRIMNVLTVFGTRPEAMKMAPVVKALAADRQASVRRRYSAPVRVIQREVRRPTPGKQRLHLSSCSGFRGQLSLQSILTR